MILITVHIIDDITRDFYQVLRNNFRHLAVFRFTRSFRFSRLSLILLRIANATAIIGGSHTGPGNIFFAFIFLLFVY